MSWKKRMLIGASMGALAYLLNRETRQGAKEWGQSIVYELKEYRKQPSKAVQDLRFAVERVDRIADTFVQELQSAENLFQEEKQRSQQQQLH